MTPKLIADKTIEPNLEALQGAIDTFRLSTLMLYGVTARDIIIKLLFQGNGSYPCRVSLWEETLTDQSKVYEIHIQ